MLQQHADFQKADVMETEKKFMTTFEINIKREFTSKTEQKKYYNHVGRI